MSIILNPYSLWLFAVAVLLFWVVVAVWQSPAIARDSLALTLGAGAFWAFCYALDIASVDLNVKYFWFHLKYLGVITIVPWWALFLLNYSRSPWGRNRYLILLLISASLADFIVVWTNPYHHLFYTTYTLFPINGTSIIVGEHGLLFWAHIIAIYTLLIGVSIYFVRSIFTVAPHKKTDHWLLLLFVFGPWILNLLFQINFRSLLPIDFGPLALAISGISVVWLLFDMRLTDLIPASSTIIFDSVSDGMLVVDAQRTIVAINPPARQLLGESVTYAIGQSLTRIFPGTTAFTFTQPPDPQQRVEFQWNDHFFEMRRIQLLPRFRQRGGQLLVLQDVTERKKSEIEREGLISQLEESLGRSRALYWSSLAVVGFEDLPTQLQAVMDEAIRVLHVTQMVLVTYTPTHQEIELLVQGPYTTTEIVTSYDALLKEPLVEKATLTGQVTLLEHHHPSQAHPYFPVAVAPVRYRGERMGALVVYGTEDNPLFSQQEGELLMAMASHAAIAISNNRLFAEVNRLAITDGLTELFNRRHFLLIAEQEFEYAKARSGDYSVMMLDVDLFKQINDKHGHLIGDEVLRGVARILVSALPKDTLIGRYGGEEFIIVLPTMTLNATIVLADTLRRRIANTIFPTMRGPVSTTISIGAAQRSGDTPTLFDLIDQADTALYKAKAIGRNTVSPSPRNVS